MTHFFGLVLIYLVFISPPLFANSASSLEGMWNCEDTQTKVNFQWDSKLIMEGQWLSGKTTSKGAQLSQDIWKIEKSGQPSLRRIYLVDGNYVELDTKGWWKNNLNLRGTLIEKKLKRQVRSKIKKIDDTSFESTWEKRNGKKWEIQSVEICQKKKGVS